jgi:hypothetical protein
MSFSTYSAFRLGIADDVNATESHSFKELMKDKKDVISDGNEKFSESWLFESGERCQSLSRWGCLLPAL